MKIEEIKSSVLIWGPASDKGLTELKNKKADDSIFVLVPENRPFMIGLNHNIPLIKRSGIPFVYCTDNMLGFLFYKKKIRKTALFYHESKPEGVVGACGSLYASLLSKLHNIPIEIIPEGNFDFSRFDTDASRLGGKRFMCEEDKDSFVAKAEFEFVKREILG